MEEDEESSVSSLTEVDSAEPLADQSQDSESWKVKRAAELGFRPQKEISYNKLLPYAADIDAESSEWFQEIKANLGLAVAVRELRPGVLVWTSRLNKYIRLYGLKFPLDDHITLIRLLYSILIIPELEPFLVNHIGGSLQSLLRKTDLIEGSQLVLEWRPLYDLTERFMFSNYEPLGLIKIPQSLPGTIKNVVKVCRHYFAESATAEMLEEWRPLLCPLDMTFGKVMSLFEMFLPTYTAWRCPDSTYKLWLEEVTGFWQACGNLPAWEPHLISLLGRLAEQNTGCIDWDPYLPAIFARVQKMFNLPVCYNKTSVGSKGAALDSQTAARWIVSTLGGGSQTQHYLLRLFLSIESYYHPANIGRHVLKLSEFMHRLVDCFIRRVHRERHKRPVWGYSVPRDKCLSNQDITDFVQSVKPVALHAMWSKVGFLDAGVTLQILATLRPELVLPALVERLSSSLEIITEPHKLTASLHSMVGVARCLVTRSSFYPMGRSQVLPLLFATLPGIDCNDMRKSVITFQFISTFAALIPFVDFSTASEFHQLTEEEQQISLQSAQFEDFVVEFLNRCFAIIENSIVLETRAEVSSDDAGLSREDTMKNVGLGSTLNAILMQSSEPLYELAARKIRDFISGRILEWRVSGKIAAGLCRCVVKVRPVKGLAMFLPMVCNTIKGILAEHVKLDAKLGEEIKFQLLILAEIISVPGRFLLPYVPEVVSVLELTTKLVVREASQLSGAIMRNTLRALTHICPTEYKSSIAGFDAPLSEYLPLRDWGRCETVSGLQIDWNIPSSECIAAAQEMIDRFLGGALNNLEAAVTGTTALSKEQLKSNLALVLDTIMGCGSVLPYWREEIIVCQESKVNLSHRSYKVWPGPPPEITVGGENVRLTVATVMSKLLVYMSTESPDDTKALNLICGIFQAVLFYVGVPREEYDNRWKSFKTLKKVMENRLSGSKKHIRGILVDRTQLQHESRMVENSLRNFTATHRRLYDDLLGLATNHYSVVRVRGQDVLARALRYFAYSYQLLLPRLLDLLKPDTGVSHEQFKGALFVLLGTNGKSFLTKHNWETFLQICPAIVEASHSEKPSIVAVLGMLLDSVLQQMDTFTIEQSVPDTVVDLALEFWADKGQEEGGFKRSMPPAAERPSDRDIQNGREEEMAASEKRQSTYLTIITTLCDQLESGRLHWRHYNSAIKILATLVRYDQRLPARAVNILLAGLVHDSLEVRKAAVFAAGSLLKQQKRRHVLVERAVDRPPPPVRPGNRADNAWLEYRPENWPQDGESWNRPNFIHKTHYGYYYWPQRMMVYAPEWDQPSLDRQPENMTAEERSFVDFFETPQRVDRLVSLLALEEHKGKDKFDPRKFILWKGLFRNYGDRFLAVLKPHIERLHAAPHESEQRCAAEMLAGLIRGSKHWTWTMTEQLWAWLVPLLKKILSNVTVETIGDWGTCFATASESRDPNRLHWLLETLMEEPLRSQGSFLDSSRLYVLQGAVAQQEWRVGYLLYKLEAFLQPYLTHPYENVRVRLGSVLTNIYSLDFEFPNGPGGRSSPRLVAFIEHVLPRLECMTEDPDPEIYNFHKLAARQSAAVRRPDVGPLGDFPTGAGQPGMMFPPGMILPPGAIPPGMMPRGMLPPGLMSPGMVPRGMMPPPPLGIPSPRGMAPPEMLIPPGMILPVMMPPPGVMSPGIASPGGMRLPPPMDLMRLMESGGRLPPPELFKRMTLSGAPEASHPAEPASGSSHPPAPLNGPLLNDCTLHQDPQLQAKWEQRQDGVRLLQTTCKLMAGVLVRNFYIVKPVLFRLLKLLCLNESSELEPDLARDCTIALACLAGALMGLDAVPVAVDAVQEIAQSASWKARISVLEFLQVAVFSNFAAFVRLPAEAGRVMELVLRLLADHNLEVRRKAGTVLGGLLHCNFVPPTRRDKLLQMFMTAVGRKIPRQPREAEDKAAWQLRQSEALVKRHSGIVGLSAVVSACPYDIPPHLPGVLMVLADHLHDPQPISGTVKQVLQDFKRTHQDNWAEHKEKFTDDQLTVLTDLLVSPSYYA